MMKKIATTLFAVALIALSFAFKGDDDMLEVGSEAPMTAYEMEDVMSGKKVSLESLKKANGLLVIFSCNTCPFVLGWEEEYPGLGVLTKKNNIGMVLVNSNQAKRDNEDSKEAMKKHYKEAGYNTPYVIDENNKLADAFGAKTTPHAYLFDENMKLVYRGSINDKFEDRSKDADQFYLNEAIEALLNDQMPDPATTRQIGCSIKRVKA